MKSAIVFSMMVLGLVGYLNLGGPPRWALDDGHTKLGHRSLSNVTPDAGGPQRLALDSSDRFSRSLSSGSDVSVSLAEDDAIIK
ncbi:MAG: hypothetical protein WBF13_02890 [Candidatus Zixiibacteriota bacterium]